jgi:glycosyltransferase involved in cell wall biosynthesis
MKAPSREPLVSAIIIFLNGEEFMAEAVESIFAQSYAAWELLLVDDGSTDGSTALARRYAAQYPEKVRYLEHDNHQNRGMSASRNLGISQAKGGYIAFLDTDDIWLPQKLEQQVAILQAHPEAAMVYGRTQIWHSWTGQPEDAERDHFYVLGVEPDTLVKAPTLFFRLLENKVQTPTTCNVVIRRDVFQDIGGFEESFRGMYEDQAFFAKVLLKAPVFVANDWWACYRQHTQSCSSNAEMEQYYAGRLLFLDWLGRYLVEQNMKGSDVWGAFQRELWQCHHPVLNNWLDRFHYRLSQIKAIPLKLAARLVLLR